jgi:CDP-diacylglycerol--serine O-phosphatidyltransferase
MKTLYLIPNLFTLGNAFCGFYAIIAAINGRYFTACVAILVAGLFDVLDGKIARVTKSSSKFGVEFDSLADLISFGVAPGLLVYLWSLRPYGKVGWLAAFLFVACGALRLARFNVLVDKVSMDRFVGLPIPMAAGTLASFIILQEKITGRLPHDTVIMAILTYALALLMVSKIKYRSFKKVNYRTHSALVIATLLLIVVASHPETMFFILFSIFTLSGPVEFLISRRRRVTKEDGFQESEVS